MFALYIIEEWSVIIMIVKGAKKNIEVWENRAKFIIDISRVRSSTVSDIQGKSRKWSTAY